MKKLIINGKQQTYIDMSPTEIAQRQADINQALQAEQAQRTKEIARQQAIGRLKSAAMSDVKLADLLKVLRIE